jgi:hypothetical protein
MVPGIQLRAAEQATVFNQLVSGLAPILANVSYIRMIPV